MDKEKEFKESDWKLFRKKIGIWQENYMQQLNKEYIALLSEDKKDSEKFWELYQRINEDRKKKGVVVEMSRSTMIMNIISLLRDGAITMDDLSDFSDICKDTIETYQSIYKRIWE